jgi:GNAT superfamily N-acetyltransferase
MNSYGLVFGGEKTSHDSGNDIAYNVVSGNDYTQVVIEGDEYILPKEAMQSDKVYDFVDKLPIEMLDEIKRSANVFVQFPTLRQGDMVVCKNSVRNDDLHTISGTAKEISNYLQGLSACRMYAKGGYVEGGEVEDENEDSNIRFLTPMPPSKLNKTGIDSLAEIIGKDDLRVAMSGALYAGNKRIVATDAHILVVLENQNYPNSLKGTIKSLWNKVPQEDLVGVNYPNWEGVIPQTEQYQTAELSIDDVLAYAYGGVLQGKKIIAEKDYNRYEKKMFRYTLRINIGNLEIFVDSLLLTRILRVFKANDVRRIVFHIGGSNQKPIKITTDKEHYGLIMPIVADGEYTFLSQKIFYPISQKDFRRMTETYGKYLKEFAKMIKGDIPAMAEGGEISMNMPLLIRVLELAKEDVKEDKEIHFIAERLQSIADKGTLTMEDYDYISGLEDNPKIQKMYSDMLERGGGGEVEDLISKGIVELKMFDTKPEHAKEYGLDAKKPLYIETLCVAENERNKGVGEKVLSYIEKYAIENGHDLIFGHITQKAKFTKDKRETFFCDIDMIKNWLHSNGYAINNENNDFHKVIQSNKLEGGGGVLLAPNGKTSNLTPEQWHLVRTPEFKAWFGDWEALENAKMRDRGMDEVTLNQLAKNVSKVVDENGEPLVLYRGNEGQMGEYGFKFKLGLNLLNKPKPQNFGFFFTDELQVAEKYRKVDIFDSYIAGSVFTIFLNANKVLDITDFGHKIGQINFVEGLIEKGIKFDLFEDLLTKIINFFDEGGEYEGWGYNTFDYFDVFPELRDLFLANGYKGIIFKEISRTYFPYNVFVAFEPEQIKLADGTNTKFDINNPDIRFESGGSVLGRGGRIVQAQENMPKFGKIGISDKYEIEAILDIGLAGVKFTKEGVQETIKSAYTELANSVNQYVISEVSKAIVNVIVNERNVQLEQGASIELLEQYDELIESESAHLEYLNKFAETQKSTLAEWVNYLNQSEYPYAFRYLILRAVLLDNYDFKNDQLVKRNKKTIRNFTAFDAGTLAELFTNKSDYLLKDFSILQLENIERIVKAKEIAKASGGGTWLKFNGGSNTPEAERRANATELMQLVQDTYWCTKTNASGQLNGGDFYVYVTESEDKKFPRIAIRMNENKVDEVRGNASAAQDLEPEMIPIAESFLEKNFQDESGKKWLESVRYNKRAYNLYLKVLEEGIFEGFVEEFIDLKKDEKRFTLDYSDRNGHIQRSENYLNENKDELRAVYGDRVAMDLNEFNPKTTEIIIGDAYFEDSQFQSLGNLVTIGGGADFQNSQVQDLGNLQTIGGIADFEKSQVQSLGNLQTIGGDAYFGGSQVQDLGNLQTIGGRAYFENSQVQDLGNLQTIKGSASFRDSQVQDLGNLQTIGGDAKFLYSQVQDLGNLQTIGGIAIFNLSKIQSLGNLQTIGLSVNFFKSQVQDLGNLQTIGGSAFFQDSQVQDLGNLQTIGENADFENSKVITLGNLQTIGGSAFFQDSQVQDLGNLQTIGENAVFANSQVQSLGNLQTIGGEAFFRNSQVQDLGNLQTIGENANFAKSQVQDLGNLQTIGGDVNFYDSQVQSLGNLQTIGGDAYFNKSKIQSLGNLQTIGGDAFFVSRTDLEAEWKAKQKAVEMGRGGNVSPSKTPAPIKERIYGSKTNQPESSASLRSASAIKLSPENISTLNKKVLEFKSKYINRSKKMTLDAVKAVMRRGMGAYSSTHRPTISGGKPNSRVAWGLARVNAFLYKAEKGIPKNPNYVQDDDLLRELGYKLKMSNGGTIYEPQLNEFDELELKKGGEISSDKFVMPSKEILEYGQFLKEKHPEVWKAGGNIFGNQAFENLKKVSKRGYWLESERWMYDKWQSFVKRHQHNHQLAGVIANVKWASWGNIGKSEAKSVIENAFSDN